MEVLPHSLGAFLTALGTGLAMAPSYLRFLRRRAMEQKQRTAAEVRQLADLHAAKEHTPTLGGLIIFFPVLLSSLLWAPTNFLLMLCLLTYGLFTILGFVDDFLKIKRGNSRGISGKRKLFWQALFSVIILLLLCKFSPEYYIKLHQIWLPMFHKPLLCAVPTSLLLMFLFFILAGTSNGVNITDGADGLAAGCYAFTLLPYFMLSILAAKPVSSTFHGVAYVAGAESLTILLGALLGGVLAFLWHNAHPAKVFMGDCGALGLGGLLGLVAFLLLQPFLLLIAGGIFVIEALSDILQVYYFKWTRGRRIFLMAPLHHHFELAGVPETRLVIRFWILSAIFAIVAMAFLAL